MSKSWRWMATAIGMVIIAGGSVGVLADRMLHREPEQKSFSRSGAIWFDCAAQPRPEPQKRDAERQAYLAEIQQELSLDDQQLEELQASLERHGGLARAFWDRTRLQYCQMRDQLRDDVRGLLREDQLPRFEERLRRIDERDRERYGRRGHDGDPRRNKQR
ncbi:MAG TPA: hypothetical protein VMV46_10395 [Thermoanaerobaculia bacterium]|nr:hypothetical protein [Thermoanaerobaculia bacterium]